MQTKKIIQFSLLGAIILTCILFFILKYQDRQNGYYGVFTLDLENQNIDKDTDEYVLNINSPQAISVGIDLKGINKKNIEKVEWFYANPYNNKIYETIISQDADGPQYFAIPRSGGEYLLGATIYYKDGKTIKTTDIFNQTMVTIWPNAQNPNIPIASLKADKTKVTLNEEINFTVFSKIANEEQLTDFEDNKKVFWDFDGDGKRDRITSDLTTKFRYTQTHGVLSYTPKIAVVYNGYTGNAEGMPMNIR